MRKCYKKRETNISVAAGNATVDIWTNNPSFIHKLIYAGYEPFEVFEDGEFYRVPVDALHIGSVAPECSLGQEGDK